MEVKVSEIQCWLKNSKYFREKLRDKSPEDRIRLPIYKNLDTIMAERVKDTVDILIMCVNYGVDFLPDFLIGEIFKLGLCFDPQFKSDIINEIDERKKMTSLGKNANNLEIVRSQIDVIFKPQFLLEHKNIILRTVEDIELYQTPIVLMTDDRRILKVDNCFIRVDVNKLKRDIDENYANNIKNTNKTEVYRIDDNVLFILNKYNIDYFIDSFKDL